MTPSPTTRARQTDSAKPKRTRDPDAKRAAILDAARAAFAERGFAGATLRDIGKRAGVTHGLVIRHFTSKEQLFLAAHEIGDAIAEDFVGELDELPDRIARRWVTRMDNPSGHDPLIALIRSAAVDEGAAKRLLAGMRDQSLLAYRIVMPGPDIEKRAEMVGAHLIGLTFSRYVLQDGPLATMPSEELIGYISTCLRAILFAPIGTSGA